MDLLEEIAKCLLLLGRCKEYVWVNNNIVMRLFKSLENSYRPDGTNQNTLLWVFSTLGLLSRVYTAEGRANLSSLFTQMTSIIKSSGDKIQAATEQCCVRALVHIGYHLQSQVAIFLKEWKPVHDLDPSTQRLLEDFVGTRGKKHSGITAHVARLEMLRSRKNRGVNRFRKP